MEGCQSLQLTSLKYSAAAASLCFLNTMKSDTRSHTNLSTVLTVNILQGKVIKNYRNQHFDSVKVPVSSDWYIQHIYVYKQAAVKQTVCVCELRGFILNTLNLQLTAQEVIIRGENLRVSYNTINIIIRCQYFDKLHSIMMISQYSDSAKIDTDETIVSVT